MSARRQPAEAGQGGNCAGTDPAPEAQSGNLNIDTWHETPNTGGGVIIGVIIGGAPANLLKHFGQF